MARTKIVATIGPATREIKTIRRLIRLGVDVFRVNFSHGDAAEHAALIENIRKAADNTPVAVMGDLCGPKIRCGRIENAPVLLKKGREFILTSRKVPGSVQAVSVNYKRLPSEVKSREKIFLDDGNIELKVLRIRDRDIICRVITGGWLLSNKGINLPNTSLSLPALTKRDLDMIRFGVARKLDFFALSFVKHVKDIRQAKRIIQSEGEDTPLIAKIEKHEAIDNLVDIIKEADGAMVARGDLGIEIPIEEVPIIQKRIINLCNELGKPVITATQMMESMIEKPRPTRAEITDIANAIIDGTDFVMLSGETAVGRFPDQAVRMMNEIIKFTEKAESATKKVNSR